MPRHSCLMPQHSGTVPRTHASGGRYAATLIARTHRPQTFEGPDAVAVAIGPHRLERVVADGGHRRELERSGDVTWRRASRHAAEEIGLTAAGRTGAGTA